MIAVRDLRARLYSPTSSMEGRRVIVASLLRDAQDSNTLDGSKPFALVDKAPLCRAGLRAAAAVSDELLDGAGSLAARPHFRRDVVDQLTLFHHSATSTARVARRSAPSSASAGSALGRAVAENAPRLAASAELGMPLSRVLKASEADPLSTPESKRLAVWLLWNLARLAEELSTTRVVTLEVDAQQPSVPARSALLLPPSFALSGVTLMFVRASSPDLAPASTDAPGSPAFAATVARLDELCEPAIAFVRDSLSLHRRLVTLQAHRTTQSAEIRSEATSVVDELNLLAARAMSHVVDTSELSSIFDRLGRDLFSCTLKSVRSARQLSSLLFVCFNFHISACRGHQGRCGTCVSLPRAMAAASATHDMNKRKTIECELDAHYRVATRSRDIHAALVAEMAKQPDLAAHDAPVISALFDRPSVVSIPLSLIRAFERAGAIAFPAQGFLFPPTSATERPQVHLHFLPKLISMGASFTLTSLSMAWADKIEPAIIRQLRGGQRNVVVAFQCDNTAKENKAKLFLRAAGSLLNATAARASAAAIGADSTASISVVVSFKLIGHTHDSLDRAFGTMAAAVRPACSGEVYTLSGLMSLLGASVFDRATKNTAAPQCVPQFLWRCVDWEAALLGAETSENAKAVDKALDGITEIGVGVLRVLLSESNRPVRLAFGHRLDGLHRLALVPNQTRIMSVIGAKQAGAAFDSQGGSLEPATIAGALPRARGPLMGARMPWSWENTLCESSPLARAFSSGPSVAGAAAGVPTAAAPVSAALRKLLSESPVWDDKDTLVVASDAHAQRLASDGGLRACDIRVEASPPAWTKTIANLLSTQWTRAHIPGLQLSAEERNFLSLTLATQGGALYDAESDDPPDLLVRSIAAAQSCSSVSARDSLAVAKFVLESADLEASPPCVITKASCEELTANLEPIPPVAPDVVDEADGAGHGDALIAPACCISCATQDDLQMCAFPGCQLRFCSARGCSVREEGHTICLACHIQALPPELWFCVQCGGDQTVVRSCDNDAVDALASDEAAIVKDWLLMPPDLRGAGVGQVLQCNACRRAFHISCSPSTERFGSVDDFLRALHGPEGDGLNWLCVSCESHRPELSRMWPRTVVTLDASPAELAVDVSSAAGDRGRGRRRTARDPRNALPGRSASPPSFVSALASSSSAVPSSNSSSPPSSESSSPPPPPRPFAAPPSTSASSSRSSSSSSSSSSALMATSLARLDRERDREREHLAVQRRADHRAQPTGPRRRVPNKRK